MNKLAYLRVEELRRSHFTQKTPKKYDIPIELINRCEKLDILLNWKQCPTKTNLTECRFVWKPIEALTIECEQREKRREEKLKSKKNIYYYEDEPDFKTIQNIVKGFFTIIIIDDNKKMYVNEEGELKKLKINKKASNIVGYNIYGNVIIVG